MRGDPHPAGLIAGVGGALLLVSLFLPWFGLSDAAAQALRQAEEITEQFDGEPLERPDVTESAWEAFALVRWVLLVTALVGIGAGVTEVVGSRGRPPSGAAAMTASLGILSSLIVLYRVLNPIGESGREWGLFVGLIGAIGVAVGGWLALQRADGSPRERAADSPSIRSR